jgi:hypothetical protein
MAEYHPAVLMLRPGCEDVGAPFPAAAFELVRFLQAKRAFPATEMSPSVTIDALWHWALLETDVIAAVHDLVRARAAASAARAAPPDGRRLRQRTLRRDVQRR